MKIITILLILVIAALGVHVFYINSGGARIDLTEQKLYSLTQGTKDILTKMNDEGVKPVELKLYFSATTGKKLPQFIKQFITYNDYVQNLLREYERSSGGKIKFDVIDPTPDSDDELDADAYGLDGKTINQYGDKFFFGLAMITQTGSKDNIDFLWPDKQQTLEYEISKKLYNLMWPTKKRIAIISSLDPMPETNPYMQQMMAMQNRQAEEPWSIMEVLQESYEVEKLDDVETIDPEKYALLMVIHPKNLSEKALWAIDEWVVKGGDTMVFVDAYAFKDAPMQTQQNPMAAYQQRRAANLDLLLNKWGLESPQDKFAVDYDLATRVPSQRGGGTALNIAYMTVDERNADKVINTESPIMQGLKDLSFYMAGVLEKTDDAPGEVTPLISTTDKGDRLTIVPGFDSDKLTYISLGEPEKLLDAYAGGKQQMLAALVQGQMPSAFPEGATFPKESPKPPPGMPPGFNMPPAEDAEMVTKEGVPADQHKPARILVFSDLDFITELAFQKSPFGLMANGDNYKVVMNAADFLTGARELMDVRSRGAIKRPFKVFDEIERKADEEMLEEEKRIRAQIEEFQEELRTKSGNMTQKNAQILQQNMSNEIAEINEKIDEGNAQLREIRKKKRAALEGTETRVRAIIVALMPIIVCIFGLVTVMKRRAGRAGGA